LKRGLPDEIGTLDKQGIMDVRLTNVPPVMRITGFFDGLPPNCLLIPDMLFRLQAKKKCHDDHEFHGI
jgi:hypothetical protein